MGSPPWARLASLGLLLLLAGLSLAQAGQLVIKNAERKINLKSQVVKVTDSLEVASSGGKSDLVIVCYPARLAARQARLKVSVNKEGYATAPADAAAPALGAPKDAKCFGAAIPVGDGESVTVDVSAAFTGVMTPNPSKIKQGEQQLMEYEDTLWVLSPYKIEEQSTVVLLPTSNLLSHSDSDKATTSGSKVSYKKLGSAEPWSTHPLKLHFHHDKAFKKVVKLVREIEVSHWGNIYVEEAYVIANAGSEHVGPFSRLDFAMDRGRTSHFQNVRAHLPPGAHSLYYNDVIGNISSSNTIVSSKEVIVDISLRYPLLGGWKTDFKFGYSLPLEGSLFHRPKGRTRLIMDLSTPIDDVVVEELETRVVLPEGSAKIEYTLPFEDMEVSWDKKLTYLDSTGRPVLVLRKSNVLPSHNKAFAVDYKFGTNALMREPMLLIMVFAALFAAIAVWHRLELTISKDASWLEARAQERAVATMQKIAALWDEESSELSRLADVTEKLADTVGIEAAHNARHAAEARLKALDAQAQPLLEELAAQSAKMAAAAREHAERGKALQQRAIRLVTEKSDLLRKGSPQEAAKKLGPSAKALQDARADWDAATASLCD